MTQSEESNTYTTPYQQRPFCKHPHVYSRVECRLLLHFMRQWALPLLDQTYTQRALYGAHQTPDSLRADARMLFQLLKSKGLNHLSLGEKSEISEKQTLYFGRLTEVPTEVSWDYFVPIELSKLSLVKIVTAPKNEEYEYVSLATGDMLYLGHEAKRIACDTRPLGLMGLLSREHHETRYLSCC